MIKMGLIGLGGMGRGHLSVIEQMIAEGADIELVALCDIDPKAFGTVKASLNLEGMEKSDYDFSKYHLYTSTDEMLANEKDLDLVNVVVPTYEHSTVTLKVLNAGINCLCEKPMGISLNQCQLMIDAAKKNNVQLMIGQCCRFGNNYRILKEIVESGKLGAPVGGHFYRGGSASGKEWYFCREKGGGGLFDQHIHDVDMIQYIYGMPKAVSTVGRVVRTGSGYDTCATNYMYDGLCVHTSNIWVSHKPGFIHGFRADFENGTIISENYVTKAYDANYNEIPLPTYTTEGPHYEEIKYFIEVLNGKHANEINPPEDSMNTIRIALAEMESADLGGQLVEL